MKLMPFEKAKAEVEGLKDRLGRPIDPGISEALVHFTRFAQALGFTTIQSCEGHIDWGEPFPWIDFTILHQRVEVPAVWEVWKLHRRARARREDEHHWQNEEQKTDQLCTMMTRYLLEHAKQQSLSLEATLSIDRWRRTVFRLQPTYKWLSEGYKKASAHQELDRLLDLQRQAMSSFASFCVASLEEEKNLVGIPDEGCHGCMGRG